MFSKQFIALATLLLPVFAVPSPLITVSSVEGAVPGRYIVTLKDGASRTAHVSSIQATIASTGSEITHQFNIINGYAGEFSTDALNDLRANPEVASIEQEGTCSTSEPKIQYVLLPLYMGNPIEF
jgi:cerevisin